MVPISISLSGVAHPTTLARRYRAGMKKPAEADCFSHWALILQLA
jgi:hypothetical protein